MRKEASQLLLKARHWVGWGLALGAASASGCATGVDVTDEELAEICAEPNIRCGNAGSSVGSVGGSTGGGLGGGSGGSSNGGTFNNGGSSTLPSSGGSFGTNGGTGGSLGASGNGGSGSTAPLAEGDCLPEDDIVVLYEDRTSGAASNNEPSMVLQVQNPSGTSFPLSDLSIRYWFTADGTGNFIATVDYASVNGQGNINSSIVISFGQEFGSDYAQMTFPSSTEMIGPQGISQLQLRFHADPYSSLNQTNDFSFLAGAARTPNRNVTPYLGGMQVGGCVPIPP